MVDYSQSARDDSVPIIDTITFFGHPLIKAEHPTTIEITRESYLSERGDCIIGVRADKGLRDINLELKRLLRSGDVPVRLRLSVKDEVFVINAFGNSKLILDNPDEIVIRKSMYIDDRTIAIRADVSARDIPRSIVRRLRQREMKGELVIEVYG